MKKITALIALLFYLATTAQTTVIIPASNPSDTLSYFPFGAWYGYERGAAVYTSAEINNAGVIDSISFYWEVQNAGQPGTAPFKLYLKEIPNTSFAAPTAVASEISGATLVNTQTVSGSGFYGGSGWFGWAFKILSPVFNYTGIGNLEVITLTDAGNLSSSQPKLGTDQTYLSKQFRHNRTAGINSFQTWERDSFPPTTPGALHQTRPNIKIHFSSTASVKTFNGNTLSIYPNPAKDILNVHLDRNFTDAICVISDASGVMAQTHTCTAETSVIDTQQLAAGIYFLSVHAGAETTHIKFVKQ